jgi:hypothetical protein
MTDAPYKEEEIKPYQNITELEAQEMVNNYINFLRALETNSNGSILEAPEYSPWLDLSEPQQGYISYISGIYSTQMIQVVNLF